MTCPVCGTATVETQALSVAEAAAVLGVNRRTAYDWIKAGTFPVRVLNINGTKRVSRPELEAYLNPTPTAVTA